MNLDAFLFRCPHCRETIDPNFVQALMQYLRQQVASSDKTDNNFRKYGHTGDDLDDTNMTHVSIGDLQTQLAECRTKLGNAEANELQLRKRMRELEADQEAIDLRVERLLEQERHRIRDQTLELLADEHRSKEAERNKTLEDLRTGINDLQRRAFQGSQQLQGEILELDLEQGLRRSFPADEIQPIEKGQRGADVLQHVRDLLGNECGSVIWEAKNTKTWNKQWIEKIKADALTNGAYIPVILTAAMPKEIKAFGRVDGVWVTNYASHSGLALALRLQLIHCAGLKRAIGEKEEKMGLLFDFLCSREFSRRVEAIVSTIDSMKSQLDREKRSFSKLWGEREKQILWITNNVAGMFGGLQGITNSALPEVQSLALPLQSDQRDFDGGSPDTQ